MRFNTRSIFITTLAAGVIACSGVASTALASTAQSPNAETPVQHVNPEDVPGASTGAPHPIDGSDLAIVPSHVNPEDVPGAATAGHRSVGNDVADSVHHVNPEDVPSAHANALHRYADQGTDAGNNDNS